MFRKQVKVVKVTKAPLSVTQTSSLSTQTRTSVSSRATASIQSVTTERQTSDELQFWRSYRKITQDFSDTVSPKSNLVIELFKMPNIRLSRINSSIDAYLAAQEVFREKLARFRKQWIATDHFREMQEYVDELNKRLIDTEYISIAS